MINFAELDLRVASHHTAVAQSNLPTARQPLAQRAVVPGVLATKFLALTARFAPHARHTAAQPAATGTAHS